MFRGPRQLARSTSPRPCRRCSISCRGASRVRRAAQEGRAQRACANVWALVRNTLTMPRTVILPSSIYSAQPSWRSRMSRRCHLNGRAKAVGPMTANSRYSSVLEGPASGHGSGTNYSSCDGNGSLPLQLAPKLPFRFQPTQAIGRTSASLAAEGKRTVAPRPPMIDRVLTATPPGQPGHNARSRPTTNRKIILATSRASC